MQSGGLTDDAHTQSPIMHREISIKKSAVVSRLQITFLIKTSPFLQTLTFEGMAPVIIFLFWVKENTIEMQMQTYSDNIYSDYIHKEP